jgi:hypothetical protein
MKRGAGGLAILLALYLLLLSAFTFQEPASKERFVAGFVCTDDARKAFKDEEACPFVNSRQLKDAGYNADFIWTSTSIAMMRMLIVLSWLGLVVGTVVVVASFLVYQMGAVPRRPS